jgi:hypothetical protein
MPGNKVCVFIRSRGVADAKLDYASLPRWMRSAHFYDIGHLDRNRMGPEWTKFVNDLKQRRTLFSPAFATSP